MASNYTSNYNLCQWAENDKVLRTEFNADNAKIDAALAGKAEKTVVSGLQSSVSGKASQSQVDGLAQTVAGHTSELAKKGNCQLYVTTYTGSGRYDSTYPNSLTFSKKPAVVFITASTERLVLVRGETRAWSESYNGSMGDVMVTWSGNTVRWYTGSARGQMNASGATYQVVALLQAD